MLSNEGRGHLAHSGRPLRTWPTAVTALAGVIGNPVEHSLSPALHNAALVDLGLDWAYVAFPVPAGRGEPAVAAMVELGIRGLSVTMPYKAAAARACHRLSPVAERLGAVNTVTNLAGYLVGDSTDGPGFIDALTDQGWAPTGKRCLVLGAGGAARAVVLALAEAGAGRVGVVARRPDKRRKRPLWPARLGGVGSVDSADDADLVVNATPVGMTGVEGDRPGDLPFGLDPKRLARAAGGGPHLRPGHDGALGRGPFQGCGNVQWPRHADLPGRSPGADMDRPRPVRRGHVGGRHP